MDTLYTALSTLQKQQGNDCFLDTATAEAALAQHFAIFPQHQRAVAWCLARHLYYQLYADGELPHLRYYRQCQQLAMAAQLQLEPAFCETVVNSFVQLADAHKKRDSKAGRPPDEERLFATLNTARRHMECGEYADARRLLDAVAQSEEPSPLASYWAGVAWADGPGREHARALAYFEAGAVHKNRDCLYALAQSYLYGHATAPDEARAIDYFGEASQRFHPDALCTMGVLQYHGYGPVGQNLIPSLYCLGWAARQGNADARAFLAVHHHREGEAGRVAGAHRYFTEATLPLAEAYYTTARIYDSGSHVVEDAGLAWECYYAAMRRGHKEAAAIIKQRFAGKMPPPVQLAMPKRDAKAPRAAQGAAVPVAAVAPPLPPAAPVATAEHHAPLAED